MTATDQLPVVGTAAPSFEALLDDGSSISLARLRGRPVVLFFYPRNDTPTCTAEACDFRDRFPRFAAREAVVLGVSPGSVAQHARFRAKHALPFPLVADPDHAIAEAYGVWQEKHMYGRKYMGVVRTTVLIDDRGRVACVWEKVRVAGHVDAVAAAVASLA